MPGMLAEDELYNHNSNTPAAAINVSRSAPSSYSSKNAIANGIGNRISSEGLRKESWEPPTPAMDGIPGGWPRTPLGMPEGGVGEGMGSSVLGVPSGTAGSERAPSAKSVAISTRTRRGSGLDTEKKAGEVVRDPAPRPGAAEEGYFTSALNGKPAGPPRSPLGRPNVISSNGSGETDSVTTGRVVSGPTPSTLGGILPVVKELSPSQATRVVTSEQGLLKPPVTRSAHRASSPPAFSHTSATPPPINSTPSPVPSRPSRLEQRHTLEVPLVNTARISADGREPANTSPDGVVSATGRFSPTAQSRRRGSLQLARRMTRSIHSHSDMQLDQVPLDEDASRFAEAIKAKRASRKHRTDTDDDRVLVGTKVDEHHSNYVRAYNMLTGIRFVVSRIHGKSDRELTEADFHAAQKYSFDISGNELTPSSKYDFKFKDYAPWVFRHIRTAFRIDPAEYLISLTAKYILSELGSPGKSGSFFYFSRDYKYIIKTIHHAEHKFLRKILKDYYQHVRDNPNTLLSQFYGLHRVKLPYQGKVHFVIMNNLFPPHRDIHRTFDLKGSTIGRDFREEELEKNPRATMKDLNWLRRNLHLEFGPTKKDNFIAQMQKDVALLQRLKIMDYSLLVGIHDLERGNDDNVRDKTLHVFQPGGEKTEEPQMGSLARTPSKMESQKRARELRATVTREKPVPLAMATDKMPDEAHRKDFYFYADDGGFQATREDDRPGDEIYYLGIIDCLTRYNIIKKAEHCWKGMGGHESQISPIPPDRYGERFVRFISGNTMSREQAEKLRLSQSLQSPIRLASGLESQIDDPRLGGVNTPIDAHNPPGTEKVMEGAEREAARSRVRGASEADVPERLLHTVQVSKGSGDHLEAATLPVIGEAQETASNTSRTPSNNNLTTIPSCEEMTGLRQQQPIIGNANMPSESLGQIPPPTPPKDGKHSLESVRSRRESESNGGPPPPTPPKDRSRGRAFEKELPLPPPVASKGSSASPTRLGDEEAVVRGRGGGMYEDPVDILARIFPGRGAEGMEGS
ncbi:Phosphatidylinositol-4-phosphate 5-kinase [Friedmanniomyces endolithicus]|uniref:Phosphatidylinositol-4-phosphate 5-kinase n=1 Tax=Rachicladosporium monterosium TaxID=1507873 RepID=A0ABR0LBK3_9PEZI|nr:Phosphatidylinositol-4-phosphate 5-kinase [Friedmanniomyces endolithicus]KAK5146388.1 Phosphatidylinositol-4-phosphate 5-kinase [Rachicladosporium monterosium]